MNSFSFFTRSVLCLLSLSFLTGCLAGTTATSISQVPISSDFKTLPIQSSDAGSETHLFFMMHDRYGYVEACGAIVTSDSASRSEIEHNVYNRYFIRANEDLIVNNLRLFAIIAPPQTPQSAQATCVATDVIWRPVYTNAVPELVRRGG